MLMLITKLQANLSGATAIEYGLIAALVSVGAIGALSLLGESLQSMLNVVSGQLDIAVSEIPS